MQINPFRNPSQYQMEYGNTQTKTPTIICVNMFWQATQATLLIIQPILLESEMKEGSGQNLHNNTKLT